MVHLCSSWQESLRSGLCSFSSWEHQCSEVEVYNGNRHRLWFSDKPGFESWFCLVLGRRFNFSELWFLYLKKNILSTICLTWLTPPGSLKELKKTMSVGLRAQHPAWSRHLKGDSHHCKTLPLPRADWRRGGQERREKIWKRKGKELISIVNWEAWI